MPVLSLNGNKGKQVDTKINQESIRRALIKWKNKNYKKGELENLNHFFKECERGKIGGI